MKTINEETLIVDYSSQKPKSKVSIRVSGHAKKRILRPGDKTAFQLKPGVYKAKFHFGFLKNQRRWIIIPPSKKPIIAHCLRDSEPKVYLEQSGFSESVARLLDNKKETDYQEMIYLANETSFWTSERIIQLLVVCVLLFGFLIFEIIRSIVKIFSLLFGG